MVDDDDAEEAVELDGTLSASPSSRPFLKLRMARPNERPMPSMRLGPKKINKMINKMIRCIVLMSSF